MQGVDNNTQQDTKKRNFRRTISVLLKDETFVTFVVAYGCLSVLEGRPVQITEVIYKAIETLQRYINTLAGERLHDHIDKIQEYIKKRFGISLSEEEIKRVLNEKLKIEH